MRTRTEILDAIRDAQARYDKARGDFDEIVLGTVEWCGNVPPPEKLTRDMVESGHEIQVLKWVLGGK